MREEVFPALAVILGAVERCRPLHEGPVVLDHGHDAYSRLVIMDRRRFEIRICVEPADIRVRQQLLANQPLAHLDPPDGADLVA